LADHDADYQAEITKNEFEGRGSKHSASTGSTAPKRRFSWLNDTGTSTAKKNKVTGGNDEDQERREWSTMQDQDRPSDASEGDQLAVQHYELQLKRQASWIDEMISRPAEAVSNNEAAGRFATADDHQATGENKVASEEEAAVLVTCCNDQVVKWPRASICRESTIIADLVARNDLADTEGWEIYHAGAQAVERWLRRGRSGLWERVEPHVCIKDPFYFFDLYSFAERYVVKRLMNELVDQMLDWFAEPRPHELWPSEESALRSTTLTNEMLSQFVGSGIGMTTPIGQLLSQHLAHHLTLGTPACGLLRKSDKWLELCDQKHDLWTTVMSKWTHAAGNELKPFPIEDRCKLHVHDEYGSYMVSVHADDINISAQQLETIRKALKFQPSVKIKAKCLESHLKYHT
jgi:hypothetical protein